LHVKVIATSFVNGGFGHFGIVRGDDDFVNAFLPRHGAQSARPIDSPENAFCQERFHCASAVEIGLDRGNDSLTRSRPSNNEHIPAIIACVSCSDSMQCSAASAQNTGAHATQ
jgi:hypothetical protein